MINPKREGIFKQKAWVVDSFNNNVNFSNKIAEGEFTGQ